ncbi:hypothetical protein KY339_02155 [Candidatus Woesearchaeota archaeon]|nr:hypothetical protein [Candidatus Woesearchaeota archaeon]
MKKLIALLLIISMLAVIGCGKEVITPTEEKEEVEEEEEEEEVEEEEEEEEVEQVSYELTSAERAKVEKEVATSKVVISTPSIKLDVGDVHVFALGINNVHPKTVRFRIVPQFESAMEMTGGLANRMEADDNTMLGWLAKNKFTTIELDMAEHIILPLIVEVGQNKAPGEPVVTGSYTFDIEVQFEEAEQFWKNYDEKSHTITIRTP